MDEVTGTLQKKTMKSGKSYYYAVLNIGGKTKWIATGLQINGNKRLAQRRLQEILQEYTEQSAAAASQQACKNEIPSVEGSTGNENQADVLFSEWVKEWLISRKIDVRECTGESYETHARVIVEYFNENQIKLSEISYSDIEEYCKFMLKEGKVNRYTGERSGYAIRTVRSQKFIITSALNWAVKRGLITNNPALTVTVSRKKNRQLARKPVFFTVKEVNDYLTFLKDKNDILYGLIYTTLMFGLRRSDDDDKIRLNQRKPSKYKGLRRFGPEKNLQRINKFMKERPIFYKNLIQMKENIRFYLRCFYCITKVMILQFNSENRTELARNG